MLCVLYLFQNRKSKHKSTSLAFFRQGRRRNSGSIGVVIWRRPSERKKKNIQLKNKVITYDNRLKNYQSNTRNFVKRLSYFNSAYQYVLPLHCLRSLTQKYFYYSQDSYLILLNIQFKKNYCFFYLAELYCRSTKIDNSRQKPSLRTRPYRHQRTGTQHLSLQQGSESYCIFTTYMYAYNSTKINFPLIFFLVFFQDLVIVLNQSC